MCEKRGIRNDAPRFLALAFLAAVVLSGCATTPQTELNWPVVTYRSVEVRSGDTVSEIADRYNVREDVVVAANGINDRNMIYPGQVLRVPEVSRVKHEQPRVAAKPAHVQVARVEVQPLPLIKPDVPRVKPDAPQSDFSTISTHPGEFVWPVEGQIIATFGSAGNGERNDGINIAATLGEPIHAAADGTVTYSGNELKGYGNLVLIRHDDGYVTAYAHAQSITVSRGDRVVKGQIIGYAGATGDVNSPQLHFEIRKGIEPVDPKPLLMASST